MVARKRTQTVAAPRSRLDDLITVDQFAELIHSSPSTIYHWISDRIGPPVTRVGVKVFYSRADIDDWIAAGGRLEPWAS